jgi:hypothetical protein
MRIFGGAIAFTPNSPRGYSRTRFEKKRKPHWRRARFCTTCRHPVPRDWIGRCWECRDRNGAEGSFGNEETFFHLCTCWWDEEGKGRSVCGILCPVHMPRFGRTG